MVGSWSRPTSRTTPLRYVSLPPSLPPSLFSISPYLLPSLLQLLPIASDKKSDSGNFDSCLETLAKASNRTLPETIMMMVPEAWQDNQVCTPSSLPPSLPPSSD